MVSVAMSVGASLSCLGMGHFGQGVGKVFPWFSREPISSAPCRARGSLSFLVSCHGLLAFTEPGDQRCGIGLAQPAFALRLGSVTCLAQQAAGIPML